MWKKILALGCSLAIYLLMVEEISAKVTPQKGPIPSEAVEIYASKIYTCEAWEAPLEKVTKMLETETTVNWINIAPFITPAHLIQGFVDLLLTVEIGEIEKVTKPGWYMRGDADDQRNNDIRAYCNGVFYDLIDTDFKAQTFNIFERDAEDGDYVILRFGLPPTIGDEYKIYIGQGQIGLQSNPTTYTDSCQIKLYLRPFSSSVFAHVDLSGIPTTYETPTPIKHVFVNTPITFDCSRSIAMDGNIVLYELDVDNNINPEADVVNDKPFFNFVYHKPGLKKVVVTVRDDKGNYSKNDGDPRASVSSNPLPLWVQVDSTTGQAELYQCAPHPYIPAQYPVTNIKYRIPSRSHVTIRIYTYSGDLVKVLVDEIKDSGEWFATWDGKNEAGNEVAAGIYFYCIKAGNFKKIKRMVVIR